jgi:hypothetical protein
MMAIVRCTIVALASVLGVTFAWGQNLVSNPSFDTDVIGWTPFAMTTIVWDSLDAYGNPASGSALVSNASTTPGDATGSRQCVEGILGGQAYHIGADILVPGGQAETGAGELLVQWYDQPGCGGFLGLVSSSEIPTSTPDVWYTVSVISEAPPGTVAARFRLTVEKNEASGSLDAHFDNVVLEPLLFGDGFESGDTSFWSSTVGGT